jgi:amino-acid N-acetyltransferase
MGSEAQLRAAGDSRPFLFSIEPARAEDVPAIARLLRGADLPSEDFARHVAHFLAARRDGDIVGAIGAEIYGGEGLLRSLVIRAEVRRAGLGDRLVREIERAAANWGVRRWWLLTTTAEGFFAKQGFRVTPRAAAPEAIAGTEEFRGLCPSSAVCLSRERRDA